MATARDIKVASPLIVPARSDVPILLSIPHSGRDYPSWLVERAKSGRKLLERLEDPLVDRLAWRLLAAGHGAVIARTPRAGIDCNRSIDDLDPRAVMDQVGAVKSVRAKVGMGLVPTRLAPYGELWRRPLSASEYAALRAGSYDPYHAAIEQELARLSQRYGDVLLLDLHSMPPRPGQDPQIVIGDRHGEAAGQDLTALAVEVAAGAGFRAASNVPFAGGHIVARHGQPSKGVHAIQVEICRSAYLARDGRTAGTGFERVATFLFVLAQRLAGHISPPHAIAAE